ncbi:MAG: agmatine deiminase family protein [Parvibaculum sp.]|nr:agmatine deiminase family protein [Parvibaculum sp.]
MRSSAHTPADDGLFMPAEWEPHARCWMQWPSRGEVWGEQLPQAYMAYAQVARAISQFEPVSMVCRPADAAQAQLACGRGVEIVPFEIDDSWARDSGPIFLIDGKGHTAGVHWRFNAWGNSYWPHDNDAKVGGLILEHARTKKYEGPMVLEGGSICADGYGTLLTTEECLLNENRNPELTRQQIEERLALHLGVRRIIWLDRGLEDDETDGHVDMICCFAGPGRVILHMPEDKSDLNWMRMQDNRKRLEAAKDAHGNKLEIIEVPQPKRNLTRGDGRRLSTSYVNFYIANGGIVMPSFDDPNDEVARKIIADAFPDRKVVQVPSLDIAAGGGVIHCITQQQPVGTPL